ncbi:MAG: amidohydrolase family protein [Anaerolineae bacterium]|nr:amidohydrolase family protein [Anaerolineae bacterium]
MIDCHTHVWDVNKHFSESFLQDAIEGTRKRNVRLNALPEEHWQDYQHFDGKAIVFGLRSEALGVNVPDEFVADYVNRHTEKLVGFMAVDPNSVDMVSQIHNGVDMGLKGIKTSPIYALYHPRDERPMQMFRLADELGLPILTHQSSTFSKRAPLRYGHPTTLDDVLVALPNLKVIIAHLGYPWERETLHVIRRYPNVYVDLSAVHYRPWDFYNQLLMYHEWHLTERILFGSDYPFTTAAATKESLLNINRFVEGTNLPRIPDEVIADILNRDCFQLLGIED